MIRRLSLIGVILLSAELLTSWTLGEEPAQLKDFKLTITGFGAGTKPIETEEIVIRNGLAYHFVSGERLEVILLDPVKGRLELIDLDRKVRTQVTFRRLEMFQEDLLRAVTQANEKREKRGGRSNAVLAAMSRDLIEPHFKSQYETSTHHLKLSNPTVQVEAQGEPEADKVRISFIAYAVSTLAKLESFRDPAGLPAFAKLETLNSLIVEHKLRPTEMSFLFRLAGPPQRVRWTYQIEPKLTEREVEALNRIEKMKQRYQTLTYEEYDHK